MSKEVPVAHGLSGTVKSDAGKPIGATVTITGLDEAHPDRIIAGAGENSGYTFSELAPGKYKLAVAAHGYIPATFDPFTMPANRSVVLTFVLSRAAEPSREETLLCGAFLMMYFFGIVAARWYGIARPNQELLRESLVALETRLATETLGQQPTPGALRALEKLDGNVKAIRTNCLYDRSYPKSERRHPPRPGFFEWVFWSGTKENAGWSAAHNIERELAAFLAPEARVFVRLRTAEQELRMVNKAPALALAETIRTTLDRQTTVPVSPAAANQGREMLASAIGIVNNARDATFFSLSEWYSKAMWMTITALFLIFFLTMAADHAVLFLVGGAGGLLSRLERSIRRSDVPLDYGASWTTLFLSPLLGALGSWIGVALIALLAHAKLLGEIFASITWEQPFMPFTLAVGAALGFSERLFDSLVNAVDQKAAGDPEPKTPGTAPPPNAPSAVSGAPGAGKSSSPGFNGRSSEAVPDTEITSVSPETLKPESLVTLHGTALDKDHIADIKLLDSAGAETPLTHVKASGDTLEFVAPPQAGKYTLRLVLASGQPIEKDLEVA